MASPFSVFRKNQKLMLAALALLAIFAFVFLPFIMDTMDTTGAKARNKVVVKTSKYGDLRESNVEDLRHQRQRVFQVLSNLMQIAGMSPNWSQQFLESTFGQATEEQVVTTWLFAQHAQEMGLVMSDDTVVNFLRSITGGKVKQGEFQAVFKQAGLSETQFVRAMRNELAVLELQRMFSVALEAVTPAQRWSYFKRVKQLAKIEAAAVPVAGYVDQVPDPGDEKLKAFFEEHKSEYPRPDSPDPGFREPQRVAIEFCKAELDAFTNKVTDAEIQQRYEKNKSDYDELEKKAESSKPKEESAKDTKSSDEPNAAKPEEAKAPDEVKAPAESKEPAKSEEPANKEPAADDKAPGSSSMSRPSPFRLAAMQTEKATAEPAKEASGKDAASQEGKQSDKDADKTGATQTAGEKPTVNESTASKNPAESKPEDKPADTKPGLSDRLKERIRRDVAYEKVQKVFDTIRAQMDNYQREWSVYEVKRIAAESAKDAGTKATVPTPPARPNFEEIAKQNGLSAGQLPLVSQWEARQAEIGSSMAVSMEDGKITGMRGDVYQFVFASLSKFRPMQSIGLKGDLFLFWKTDEAKERVPKFSDDGVRARVLAAWKLVHARPMAMKRAETLAAEAAKSGKPLKEAFEDRTDMQIITPPPFSWLTFGSVPLGSAPNAARISRVEGVPVAGEEFMRTVFGLVAGGTGAQFNAPKNAAYVIRLDEFTPTDEVLWQQFEVDDFSKYAAAAREDRRQVFRDWLEELKTSAGFKWERKPDQFGEAAGVEQDGSE